MRKLALVAPILSSAVMLSAFLTVPASASTTTASGDNAATVPQPIPQPGTLTITAGPAPNSSVATPAAASAQCTFSWDYSTYPNLIYIGVSYATYVDCTPGSEWTNQATLRNNSGSTVSDGDVTESPETTSSGAYEYGASGYTYQVVQYATADAPPGDVWTAAPADCTGVGTDYLACVIKWGKFTI